MTITNDLLYKLTRVHRRSQGVAKWAMPSKFLSLLVVLCFRKRSRTPNIIIWPLPKFWAGYGMGDGNDDFVNCKSINVDPG